MGFRSGKLRAGLAAGIAVAGAQVGAGAALVPYSQGFESFADNETDLSPLTTVVSHGSVTLRADDESVTSPAYEGSKFLTIGWSSSTGVTGTSLARVPSSLFRTNNDPMQFSIEYAVKVTGTELDGTTDNVRGNAHFVLKDSANTTIGAVEMYDSLVRRGTSTGAIATGQWMLITIGVDEVAGTYSVDVVNTSNNESLLSVSGVALGGNGIVNNFYVAGAQYPNSAPGALFLYDAIRVVPEPASLSMLAIGTILLLRPRIAVRD